MERVLKPHWLTSFLIVLCLLGSAQSISATTAIVPPDDDLIIGARVIVKGKVLSIESSLDPQQDRIFTYIKLKVQDVLKGQIAERKIVIKELGGRQGERLNVVYGNPEFAVGEQVLVYLDTWRDGSLRTYQMFLGKFSIIRDQRTGRDFAVRGGDEHVTVLPSPSGKRGGVITDRMEVSEYIAMVRRRLEANVRQSRSFEQTYYSNVPTLASPPGYVSDSEGTIQPNFALFNNARWYEPDTGQAIPYTINPHPSNPLTDPNTPQLVVDPNDIAAAASSWSSVQNCALRLSYAGNLDNCYTSTGTPGINVVSNNCDGRNSPTTGCAGILAWGGYSAGYYSNIVINGTTFQYRITQGFVSCNPWAACNFGDHCSVQFIVTHEMGHALGLGHSQYQQATMYAIAYYIARCAVLWTDDEDGIRFIYPVPGGGPGPLSVTTTALLNGAVGTSYSQSLQASGGTPPYSWSLVAGQGTLPPGLNLSSAGVISGTPTTEGTYNFTVKATDSASGTAQKALSIVVVAGGGGGPLNSQFVSQNVPTSLQPGQTFTANIKFLNTGTTTWSGTPYYYASQNPALNQTWGGNGVSLFGFVAGPGQTMDVTFTATAPSTPGMYNFQWQMYENGGAGFFGQMSTNVAIQVGSAPPTHHSDTIGLYNPNGAAFFLRNSNDGGIANLTFTFGPAGAGLIPLVGDWNGDGVKTVGLYDPAHAGFFLRNSNTGGIADVMFTYGPAGLGLIPIVGDWNGDGVDTVGLYDPAHAAFFLRNSNSGGIADITFTFGPAGLGFVPLVGDWNGDGIDTIGLYDPANAGFFLRNSNSGGVADLMFTYGAAGQGLKAIVGDWNADGIDTIGLYDPAHAGFFLRNTNDGGIADMMFTYGPGGLGLIPILGDWDGL